MFSFVVKFEFLRANDTQAFEYDSLLDALTVAKNTNVSDSRAPRNAMSDGDFNEKFFELITQGVVFAGARSIEFPDGDIRIHLTKIDQLTKRETPLYKEVGLINVLPMIPHQNGHNTVTYIEGKSKKQHTFYAPTRSEALAFMRSFGDENNYELVKTNFHYDESEV